MSSTPAPRVRDRARDAASVMVFSAACSGAVAVGLLLLTHLLPRLGR